MHTVRNKKKIFKTCWNKQWSHSQTETNEPHLPIYQIKWSDTKAVNEWRERVKKKERKRSKGATTWLNERTIKKIHGLWVRWSISTTAATAINDWHLVEEQAKHELVITGSDKSPKWTQWT